MQDDITDDEDDEERPWWRQLLHDVLVLYAYAQAAFEWWPRDNWQHWAVYPITFFAAWYVFDRARDLLRRLRARRNAPTVDLSDYRPPERKVLPPSH